MSWQSARIIINVTIDREDRAYEYQANYSSALKTCRDFLRIHDGITKITVSYTHLDVYKRQLPESFPLRKSGGCMRQVLSRLNLLSMELYATVIRDSA